MTALSQVRASQIVESLWGKATAIDKLKAVMICVDYGLNPLAKHLFLIPYDEKENGKVIGTKWEIVYGIKAKRLIAYRRGPFSYADNTPRIMTADEELRIYGNADPNKLRAITILVDDKGGRFPGWGEWNKVKVWDNKESPNNPKGSEKGNSQANMALIRSEANALERFAPGEMPPSGDTIDADFEELPPTTGELITDQLTGEIKEKPPEKTTAPEIKTTTQTESDIMFDALLSASKKPFAVTEDTADWVKTTIYNLRKTDCHDVTGNKLAERWRDKYHVSQSLEGMTIKQSLIMLLPPDIEDFCKWLQELELKYPAPK